MNIETALFILEFQKRILFLLTDIRAQVADDANGGDCRLRADELEEAAHSSSVTKQKMVSQRGK